MKKTLQGRLTYANVISTLALFLVLTGGAAYAANQLAKNSVGAKQLKKNAVTTAKIKNQAVTAAKVKKGTLTGKQIKASTLGTVPTAQTANTIAAPEPWHEVGEHGEPGEPPFQNNWSSGQETSSPKPLSESVAFYKDHEGIVHLRGVASNVSSKGETIFQLPPGFRPPGNKRAAFLVSCESPFGGECLTKHGVGLVAVYGSVIFHGEVLAPPESILVNLNGITFRAES